MTSYGESAITTIIQKSWDRRPRETNEVSPPAGLLEIQGLNSELQEWPLHHLESGPRQTIAAEVFPRAAEFLVRTRDLLASIGTENSDATPRDVSTPQDIVFFALRDITKLQQELSEISIPTTPTWRLIEVCERQRGQLMKVCSALHRALCRQADYECLDTVSASELMTALRVRTRLAKFRRMLADGLQAAGDELVRRMRSAGTIIAMMVGSNEYDDFRLGDRVLIHGIQRDIGVWLASSSQESHKAERIWEDLMGFVAISQNINRRTELQEHDEQAISQLLLALDGYPLSDPFPTKLRLVVGPLLGCHRTLDQLIESKERRSVRAWREALDEVRPTITCGKAALVPPQPLPTSIPCVFSQSASRLEKEVFTEGSLPRDRKGRSCTSVGVETVAVQARF